MDEGTVTGGLLLEAAQNNQKLVEASVQKLEALIKLLRELPREIAPELKASIEEAHRQELATTRQEFQVLTRNLRHARERMGWTRLAVGGGVVLTAVRAVAALLLWALPSPRELAALRPDKARLEVTVTNLESRGGRAHLRNCANPGDKGRQCIAVEKGAGEFSATGEHYMVLKGY
jgi:hypothetical protein